MDHCGHDHIHSRVSSQLDIWTGLPLDRQQHAHGASVWQLNEWTCFHLQCGH